MLSALPWDFSIQATLQGLDSFIIPTAFIFAEPFVGPGFLELCFGLNSICHSILASLGSACFQYCDTQRRGNELVVLWIVTFGRSSVVFLMVQLPSLCF